MSRKVRTTLYATTSGGKTLDQDEMGGNPFATALITLSQKKGLALPGLLPALQKLTQHNSGNRQTPAWDAVPPQNKWEFPLALGSRTERRIALVLVVSDYACDRSVLTGAAHDERRIASMLAGHGFTTIQGVPPDRLSLMGALRSFAARSALFETAVIYSTGHGIECEGQTYLIPGDFPSASGLTKSMLIAHAVPVSRMAASCKATQVNLTFFAGCREIYKP